VPDGKTGPWMRGPRHEQSPGGGYAFDERCDACVTSVGYTTAHCWTEWEIGYCPHDPTDI